MSASSRQALFFAGQAEPEHRSLLEKLSAERRAWTSRRCARLDAVFPDDEQRQQPAALQVDKRRVFVRAQDHVTAVIPESIRARKGRPR